MFYAYLAASVADPWIGEQLAAAERAQTQRVAECLENHALSASGSSGGGAARVIWLEIAQRLVALADGCTQAVYLGYITAEAGASTIEWALGEALGSAPRP